MGALVARYISLSKRKCEIFYLMDWRKHIGTQKDVLGGKPIILGTRLSVEFLLGRMADGWTEVDILNSYPSLSAVSLQAVHAYVYELIRGDILYLGDDRKAA